MSDANQIRINELARELEIKAKVLIDYLPEIGVTEKKTHSSSHRSRARRTGAEAFPRSGGAGSRRGSGRSSAKAKAARPAARPRLLRLRHGETRCCGASGGCSVQLQLQPAAQAGCAPVSPATRPAGAPASAAAPAAASCDGCTFSCSCHSCSPLHTRPAQLLLPQSRV